MDWIAAALGWVTSLAGQWWVYPALYALVVGDAFLVVLPGEVAVASLAALAASTGEPMWWLVVLVAAAAALSGDLACYAIGRWIGLDRWRWQGEGRLGAAIRRFRLVALRREAVLIFTARYIPFARIAVNLALGAARIPLRRYLPLAATAGLAWALFQVGIGTALGRIFQAQPLLAVGASIVSAIALGLLVDRVIAFAEARRVAREAAAGGAEESSLG